MINLSPHFTLSEFLRSNTAASLKINNSNPTATQIDCMRELCVHVLEPLRLLLRLRGNHNAVIIVTSGYRCPTLNIAVGGNVSSGHQKGQAADIHIEDGHGNEIMTAQQLFDFILASGIEYDQCICEFDEWVHISCRRLNRKQHFYAWYDAKGNVRRTTKSPNVFGVLRIAPPIT